MRQRLDMLRRLVGLYAVVEETHSVELQQITAAVRETELSIMAEQDMAKSARFDGRSALAIGDLSGWFMSENQQEMAGWRRQQLEQVHKERERLNNTARQRYIASRLKREQMKHVFDEIAAQMKIEEERQMQAASDDRFLARTRWIETKDKVRVERQMKRF